MKLAWHSVATALASSVLPQPGGPKNSTAAGPGGSGRCYWKWLVHPGQGQCINAPPRELAAWKCLNRTGLVSGQTIARLSCDCCSSSPPMASQLTCRRAGWISILLLDWLWNAVQPLGSRTHVGPLDPHLPHRRGTCARGSFCLVLLRCRYFKKRRKGAWRKEHSVHSKSRQRQHRKQRHQSLAACGSTASKGISLGRLSVISYRARSPRSRGPPGSRTARCPQLPLL